MSLAFEQDHDLATTAAELTRRFERVRRMTEDMVDGVPAEDLVVQSMEDASPAKWHLAHTTWFFETFLLKEQPGYAEFDSAYGYLFNSYYEAVGDRHPRPRRGMLSRPTSDEVMAYRRHVNRAATAAMGELDDAGWARFGGIVELGLHHEMQHQELLLTDILHMYAQNSLCPAFRPRPESAEEAAAPMSWVTFDGGLREIGDDGSGFAFDAERPRHTVFLQPFRLASRPVTNGEWRGFIDDGGYSRPELWLSDAWAMVQGEGWSAPLYWRQEDDDGWSAMGLHGRQAVRDAAPVCHISYFEADAYARWAGKRLPREAELEFAAEAQPVKGNFLEQGALRPEPAGAGDGGLAQIYGDVWEWTASAFLPYPGFAPPDGAIGEYNGKFMSGQMVLRGGSCATPADQLRPSYRNFFYPHQRWQFSGVRLAETP